jgi:hypothetical protein
VLSVADTIDTPRCVLPGSDRPFGLASQTWRDLDILHIDTLYIDTVVRLLPVSYRLFGLARQTWRDLDILHTLTLQIYRHSGKITACFLQAIWSS